MHNILINGQPGERIAVTDRALHYGDGLFETIAVINGSPRFWERHISRLHRGCERLGIPLPDRTLLREEVGQIACNEAACVVKIIVSRGSGGRGYRPPAVVEPTRLVMRYPFPDYPLSRATEGIELRVCDTPLGCNPRLAGIKHLNRLEQVLARSEWDDERVVEGIMLDSEGHLVDGTMSNLFLVIDGVLCTPELSRCGVEGVVRATLIDLAQQQGIPLRIAPIKVVMLARAEEVFVSNALIGIWPVNRCGELRFTVGPVTGRLQALLATTLESGDA
ncbi:MAG TPA: aminodeoxychorismate lyase [Gammaproteobacteria bacterium]